MSFPRAVPPILSCHACSTSILRSFSTSAAPNALRASWTASRSPFASTNIRKRRNHHLTPPDTQPGFNFLESSNSAPTSILPADQPAQTSDTSTPEPSKPTSPPIPWYLRDRQDPSRAPLSPEHAAREAIPELPTNPPPLLQTLLEYISLTAGLDDLSLFDLRHLDPPPALGSKLIMIIGTARSEKHLHVAADRFCRYLRREHGLRANAAGLLGRNELKIKLRRKAKRMKMLANVGGSTEEPIGNLDDGIRTGWICCTIGRIEAHPDDTEIPGTDAENFVGFRDVKPGVHVVVQMFTEEKREEIDLETLWSGVLRSHERKDAVADEMLKELDEHVTAGVEAAEEAANSNEMVLVEETRAPAAKPPPPPRQWATPTPTKGDPFPLVKKSPAPPRAWADTTTNRGDVFPPAPSHGGGRQRRRLHTVGLTRSL